jgi:XTP/dITP diphosphohydrolase
MNLWIATTNQGKLRDFQLILKDLPITIKTPKDLPAYSAPEETGTTFEDNARIKAKSMKALCPGEWVLGEDSGLAVEGLGGLPGVHSARYAGPRASDAENTAKLLKMIQIRCPQQRSAKYVSFLVVYDPEGQEYVFSGEIEGQITTSQRGKGGFGYDPVFAPVGQEKTFAELDSAYKNKVSHRAVATRKFLEFLKTRQL